MRTGRCCVAVASANDREGHCVLVVPQHVRVRWRVCDWLICVYVHALAAADRPPGGRGVSCALEAVRSLGGGCAQFVSVSVSV